MTDPRDELFAQIVGDAYVDPRPLYRRMAEVSPVYRTPFGIWWVLSYDLAKTLLTDKDTWTVDPTASLSGAVPNADRFVASTWAKTLIHSDGAVHDRLHSIVKAVFKPATIRSMREHVEATVQQQLVEVAGKEEFDLRWDFAEFLPTRIILDLLGIDEQHLELFMRVAEALAQVREPSATPETLQWGDDVWLTAAKVVEETADSRRREPRADLMTALIEAEDSGERLTRDELVAMVMLIAVAGQETTGQMMCSGFYHLLTHPEQLAALRADRGLMARAIEEALRYDTATRTSVARYCHEDTQLGDVLIHAGEPVMAVLSAANVDPDVFENPLAFDIHRSPSRHMGFGMGHHHCLGSALARTELDVVWNALLDSYASIEVEAALPWKTRYLVRGLESMPLRVQPAPARV